MLLKVFSLEYQSVMLFFVKCGIIGRKSFVSFGIKRPLRLPVQGLRHAPLWLSAVLPQPA